jgi:hypothetical protein
VGIGKEQEQISKGARKYIIRGDANKRDIDSSNKNYAAVYGEIYVEGIDVGIVLAAQDTYYQLVVWSPGGAVNGEFSGTSPDITNDHIVINQAGKYLVHWHVSCYSMAANEYELEVFVNDGAVGYDNTEAYRTTSTASAIGLVSGGGICNFDTGDTVELWVERKDGDAVSKTFTVRQATLSVMKLETDLPKLATYTATLTQDMKKQKILK